MFGVSIVRWAALWSVVAAGELRLQTWSNSAMHGPGLTNSTISGLHDISLSFKNVASAEITGTLKYSRTSLYTFDCTFNQNQIVFVWIQDHLVCHTNPPFANAPSSTDGCPEYPISAKEGEIATVVVHVYNVNSTEGIISVKWAELDAPLSTTAPTPDYINIPTSILSPTLPQLELKRRELQNSLKQGWSLWSYNMLGLVRLPDSSVVTTCVCQISSQACLKATHIEDKAAEIRVGVYAVDASYFQYYLGYKGINISISVTGGVGDLNALIEPLNCNAVNCSDYALVVTARFAWERRGTVAASAGTGILELTPQGMSTRKIGFTESGDLNLPLPAGDFEGTTYIAMPLTTSVGFAEMADDFSTKSESEGTRDHPSLSMITKIVNAAKAKEYSTYRKFGSLTDVAEGIQSAVLWNYIYHPAEYGPMLPVSRQWNFVRSAVSLDWGYVLFDWDNYFASLMVSISSKAIAYSNLIQVTRSRTARGFVPNFSAGGSKSIDRTEPPIGAKVLLELYKKYNDTWIVELLYDDLLKWNSWFVKSRMFGPLGIISLGSDNISGFNLYAAGQMQGARFESGLDNSPMWDDPDNTMFKTGFAQDGAFSTGQMQLYDVGFASMFVSDAEALATLAGVIGRHTDIPMLKARAASQRGLISEHLWDEVGGIFTNRRWNGSFYRRVSPTSFYSLMASAASDEQATQMMNNWFHSPDHFCIARNGDFAGNTHSCWYGLPSIEASDPAFPALGYWRGYVWGPMAQLTYWSLQEYDHVPVVQSGRKALCRQMRALMMSQWTSHRHICENFSPALGAPRFQGDCSGTKFYHWGALTGLISLIEDGFFY